MVLKRKNRMSVFSRSLILQFVFILTACGGGDGASSDSANTSDNTDATATEIVWNSSNWDSGNWK